MSRNSRLPIHLVAGCLLALVCSGLPLRAWKTTLGATNSVHGRITKGAVALVKYRNLALGKPGNNQEWDRFGAILSHSTGWLNNDANAHGNLLWNEERFDPDDKDDPGSDPTAYDSLNFNGGPFYRWWVRSIQAVGVCSTIFPALLPRDTFEGGLQEWARRPDAIPGIQSADKIYRYAGLMAHLIQDNTAPAHVANIRHAWWDGVEWWHDTHGWTLGGGGKDTPGDPEDPGMGIPPTGGNGLSWEPNGRLQQFYSDDMTSMATNLGSRNQKKLLSGYLKKIIEYNRNSEMPGITKDLSTIVLVQGQVQPMTAEAWATARLLSFGGMGVAGEASQLRDYEEMDSLAKDMWYFNPLGSHPLYSAKVGPFLLPLPAGAPARGESWIKAKGQWFSDPEKKLSQEWHQLNDGGTLWIPNFAYTGEAFDRNWGSYGGALGFPGRDFPRNKTSDILADAIRAGTPAGRLTPGDLYLIHPDQDYKLGVYKFVSPSYRDDRSWESVKLNPMLPELGGDMLDTAAKWEAVFYEQFSRELPPMLTRFAAVPRRISGTSLDAAKDPMPWFSPGFGAILRIGFDTNRAEDHVVEVWALPAAQFEAPADATDPRAQTASWKRPVFEDEAKGKILSLSDLTVWGDFPELADWEMGPSNPREGESPLKGLRPEFDYFYYRMVGFPLKVRWGHLGVQEWNLTSSPAGSAATFKVSASRLEDNWNGDRLPWSFKETFTWDGEVEDPKLLFPDSGAPLDVHPIIMEERKVLPGGHYFLMVMIYKDGRRHGFARNQFKLLNQSKHVLEFTDWPGKKWDNKLMEEAQARSLVTPAPPKSMYLIPDELFPIRVDARQPTLRITVQ